MNHIKVPLGPVLEYHEIGKACGCKRRSRDFLSGLVGNLTHHVGNLRYLSAAEGAPLGVTGWVFLFPGVIPILLHEQLYHGRMISIVIFRPHLRILLQVVIICQ